MIHALASVDPAASLAPGVRVDAFAHIGPDVHIGADTWVGPHAVILGPTRIGARNKIHAHACLGGDPQSLDYAGEPTTLEMGDDNQIREFVTVQRGTHKFGGETRIGSHCMFMAYSHVGHDCRVGDHVVLTTSAIIGGHVVIEDHVNISGHCAVHQFVRIGRYAMIGGGSIVVQDVPPYAMAAGPRARLFGLNRVGLKRAGFSSEALAAIRHAYREVTRTGTSPREAAMQLRDDPNLLPEAAHLLEFVLESERGIMR